MKHQLPGFLSGILVTTMVLGLGISALAATGALTIEVNPINVQVNGQTFQPKDAAGKTVPVFAYNGTTYAPLRALAEAYGLKVGYDAATNMATVGETTPAKTPDKPADDYSTWTAEEEKAYQEFKGMWKVENRISNGIGIDGKPVMIAGEPYPIKYVRHAEYTGSLSDDELKVCLLNLNQIHLRRMLNEMKEIGESTIIRLFDSKKMIFAITIFEDGKILDRDLRFSY